MENKTPIESLIESIQNGGFENESWTTQEIIDMLQEVKEKEQPHIEQESIGFAEWLNNDDTKEMLLESPVLPSTSDLYQIYSQQKGK